MPENNDNPENPEEEYKEVSDNLRHHANFLLVQFTIFIALTGCLITVLYKDFGSDISIYHIILKVAGILLVFLFWIIARRTFDYRQKFKERAIQLEEILGYNQYRNISHRKFLNVTNATHIIYFGVIIFWLILILMDLFCYLN